MGYCGGLRFVINALLSKPHKNNGSCKPTQIQKYYPLYHQKHLLIVHGIFYFKGDQQWLS